MGKMERKIAFCINQIHDGGAERVIVNIANNFHLRGYKVFMITSHKYDDEYPLNSEIARYVLDDYAESQNRIVKNIRWIKVIHNICKSEGIDCIIGFMRESNVRVILSTLGLATSSIVSVRGNPQKEYDGKVGRIIKRIILPLTDGCVLQTSESVKYFPRCMQKSLTVIPNPIGKAFFDVERSPIRGKIVTCGRLDSIKNHPMLIRAFSRIKKHYDECTLDIYGVGEEKDRLQRLINELGIAGSAHLVGKTNHVEQVLSKADIFVLSSDSEGMPNALMEAMAAGVTCISTDCPCGGPASLIENYESGILIDVGDEDALVKALEFCLADGDSACRMGIRARQKAKCYSNERVLGLWERYCDDVINK